MKWKDYNVMSVKDKEEYNYRFKDKMWFPDTWEFIDRLALYTMWLIVASVFLLLKGQDYSKVIKLVPEVVYYGLIFGLIIVLLGLINNVFYYIKEHLWLKKKGYSKDMKKVSKK